MQAPFARTRSRRLAQLAMPLALGVLVTRFADAGAHSADAVSLQAARVPAWRDVVVPRDLDAAAFEAFLLEQATATCQCTEQPFVFRVEGRFAHLLWHGVSGEAPAAGQGAHGAGHANARSGMNPFRQPGASGQLVGVYSGPALAGVVSHAGERLHIHYIDAAASLSGHVDRLSIAAGATQKLPAH